MNHYGLIDKIALLRSQVGEAESVATTRRGNIYDRNFAEIALDLDKISVFCRNREVTDVEGVARVLAEIVPQDIQLLRSQLSSSALRTWLAEGISKADATRIKRANLQGVYLDYQPVRYYPQKDIVAHLIGFVQNDVGLAGVEYYFDKLLSRAQDEGTDSPSFNGIQDLVLTLDLQAQTVLQKLLLQIAEDQSVERIAGYVIETATGKLVAGAQYPFYDPNHYRDYSHSVLGNMFLQPIPVPAKIRGLLEDTAVLYGSSEKGDKLLPWSVVRSHKNLAGELLLWNWLGLDSEWRPDFSISEKEVWGEREYSRVQLSYRDFLSVPESVTPLQLLTGLASMTGSGKPIRGHVVEKMVSRDGEGELALGGRETPFTNLTQPATRAIPEVQELLVAQGKKDSVGMLFLEDEQPLLVHEGGRTSLIENKIYFVSMPSEFAGLALLVSVEKNSNVVEEVAQNAVSSMGAVLKRISALQQVSESLSGGVRPQLGEERESFTLSNMEKDVAIAETTDEGPRLLFMPDLFGLSLRKSLQLLKGSGCSVHVEGTGWVDTQYPPSGSVMKDVQTCRVTLQSPERVRREVVEVNLSRKN